MHFVRVSALHEFLALCEIDRLDLFTLTKKRSLHMFMFLIQTLENVSLHCRPFVYRELIVLRLVVYLLNEFIVRMKIFGIRRNMYFQV